MPSVVESGGSLVAFMRDPFQVNNPGDWNDKKGSVAGLTGPHQMMTPEASAAAAAEWLRYKGWSPDGKSYRGDRRALRDYNGNKAVEPGSSGLPNMDWYAQRIMDLAKAAKAQSGE